MDTGTTTRCPYWPSFETLEPRLLLSTTIDLTINEISGVNRVGEPVTSGVPLPDGGITSIDNIRLMDGAQEVPAQFKVLSRWNAEVDQTGAYIKWVLVDFQADVSAGSPKVYTLEYGSEISHGSFGPDLLTDNGTYHSVDTGPLEFDVDHSAFKLFNGVTVNGQTVVADSAGNQVIVLEDETGASYTSTLGMPSDIVVEENGPLKAVIQVRGPLVNDGSVSYWDRDSQAEYAVTDAGGTTTVTIDQDSGSGGWVSVGTYTFNAGGGGYVTLTHDSEDANPTIADGVRFVKVVGGTEYLVDNHHDPTRGRYFSVTGEWDESVAIDEFNIDYFDPFVYPSSGSSLFTKEVGATATWTPDLAEAGDYEVFVWYSAQADPNDFLGPEAPPENTRIIQSMPYVEYNARITVYKDKDYAKVLFIMENNGTAGFFPEMKYTDAQSVFIEDLRLNTQMIDFGSGATVHTPTGSYALNDQTVAIGTDGEYGQRYDFGPDTFDYTMTIGASTADTGTKYDGWMEVSNTAADRNVAVGVKHFWQKHPGALAFSGSDMLSVAVLPAGGGYPQLIEPPQYESTNFDLDGGRHVSWEMTYRFSTGARSAAATDAAMLAMNDPLFAFAPSDWYETTGAWGNLARESVQVNDAELQTVIDRYEQLLDAMVDPAAVDDGSQVWIGGLTLDQMRGDAKKWFGYMNFGEQLWAAGFSSNHYDWSQAMFLHAIRHGDPQFYRMAQQLLPHERDVDQYWGQASDAGGEHLWSKHLSRYEKDNHNNDSNVPTPKQSHNWNGGLVLSYLLTGDMEALRAAEEHGKFAANRWSGALTTQFEAGTEIRNEGWTITGLLNIWRATGKQQYLDLALGIGKNVVLYTEWDLCGGNGVTAGPMVDPAPGFTGRTDRMENTSWMYLNESIQDLYQATGDAELGGLIVRMADFHMEHNFYGGDYDVNGDYRPLLTDYFYVGDEDRDGPSGGGSAVIRPFYVNTIAEAYRISGDAKYLLFARKFFRDTIFYYTGGNWYIDPDVYRAPLSYNDFRFPGTSTKVKGWMLRAYQNYLEIEGSLSGDVTAPSDITDLAAGNPTATSVDLTWTAPGNDGGVGTAAYYDIRYSTSPITEANWDSATEVVGEPIPQSAGSAESMTVTGLSTGQTYYFAMKTSDLSFNESALSNGVNETPVADVTAPAAVTDLGAGTVTETSIQVTWTATGDDGTAGTATSYDLRYSTSPIDAGNFASATPVAGVPAPQPSGTPESFTVGGLTHNTTYYFALKVTDDAGNTSGLSNVPGITTVEDAIAPAAVTDLATSNPGETSIDLTWTAPGDDGATGTATSYDVRYSTSPINEGNWASATQAVGEPSPLSAGSSQGMTISGLGMGVTYYFAIKTTDNVGNVSALSNVPSGTTLLDSTPPAAVTDLSVDTAMSTELLISWTAPGDDGTTGTATSYDVRYSTSPISDDTDFNNATQATGEPVPSASGSPESMTITNLLPVTTYYVAIKTTDNSANVSSLSNVATGTTADVPGGINLDFETPGSENDFVNMINNPGISRIAEHGGYVLALAGGNQDVRSARYDPAGGPYSVDAGTFSADVHLRYYSAFGGAGSKNGIILKEWTDSLAQYGGYVVTVWASSGSVYLYIGASSYPGAASGGYYGTGSGHGNVVSTTVGTFTDPDDGQFHSLGWWNVEAVMSIVNGTDVQIDVTVIDDQANPHYLSYTDNGAAAVVGDGAVGLSVSDVFTVGSQFDNFTVIPEGAALPTVTLSATDAAASETGPDAGTFTVTRDDTAGDLVVLYTVSGTAGAGDYSETLSGSVTILDGQASANITVTPVDDGSVEGDETVILTLAADAAYTVGSPSAGTVTIADNDVPAVSITATDASASEVGPDAGQLTVTRDDTTGDVTVYYNVSGTASAGDYSEALSGSVTILDGQASAVINITPVDDSEIENDETVTLTLVPDAAYTIGSPSSDTVTIASEDVPSVSIVATDAAASESGPDAGTFTVTRSGTGPALSDGDLTVSYNVSGTAGAGDYSETLAGSVVIPDGQASATVTITPVDDSDVEGDETVTLTLASGSGYTVGAPSSDTVTIADNDVPTVSISATDASASEVGPDAGQLTVTRDDTTGDVTVYYNVSGTASAGDYSEALSGSVTILDGQASAVINITPVDDSEIENDETVTLTLVADAAYTIGSPSSDTVTIASEDVPSVSIVATDAAASEEGPDAGAFTVTRNGTGPALTDGDLTVNYSVGGTAAAGDYSETLSGSVTIPDGQASAAITITPVDDGDVEGDETVALTVTSGSGYTVGAPGSDTMTIADNDQLVEPTVVDFETPGDENGFVNLVANPTIARVTGNGGYVLEVGGGNQDTRTAKYSPGGVDFTMAEGTVSADVHLRYFSAFGGVGSYNGLLLKDWTDSLAQYGGYVVVLNANGGNIDVRIGASNVPGAGPSGWYSSVQGHSNMVQQTIATFTDPDDGQTHSLGWWNVEAVMTVVNDTDVQIDVTVTDDVLNTYNVSYTDSGAAAVTGSGVVGVSVNDVFALHSQMDNYTLIPSGAVMEPEATIVANDAGAAEAGPDAGQFTVTLDAAAVGDVDVNYTVSGTASSGDYSETLSGVVTVPDGQTTAAIDITPVDDSEVESDETVTLTLAAGSGYTVGSPDSGTVTIVSDDVPEVTIAATDPSASETGPDAGTLTITRSGTGLVTQGDLTVNYNVSGTASAADYTETLTGSAVIPDGQGSVDVTITPVDDPDVEGDETVTLTVAAGAGYTVGATDSDTVTIADNDVAAGILFEHGVVTGVDNTTWKTVNLTNTYTSMVVIATPVYDTSSIPLVTRIRNASGSSFQLRVDRTDGLTAPVTPINVHCFVVEEGVYTLAADGVKMEAVTFTSTVTDENNSWDGESRTYANTYTTPVVVGQVMTYNDPDWSAFWACGGSRGTPPSGSTLKVGKHVGEDSDTTRADETIGYVVVEAGSGTLNDVGFYAAVSSDFVRGPDNSPPYTVPVSGLPTVETAVASQAGMDGNNGGWAVLYGPDPLSLTELDLMVDEDQANDSERRHTTEQVAYLVIDPPVEEGMGAPDAPADPAPPVRPVPVRPVRGIRRMFSQRGGSDVVLPEILLPGLKAPEVGPGPAGVGVPTGATLPQPPAGRAVRNVLAELEPLAVADLLPLQ